MTTDPGRDGIGCAERVRRQVFDHRCPACACSVSNEIRHNGKNNKAINIDTDKTLVSSNTQWGGVYINRIWSLSFTWTGTPHLEFSCLLCLVWHKSMGCLEYILLQSGQDRHRFVIQCSRLALVNFAFVVLVWKPFITACSISLTNRCLSKLFFWLLLKEIYRSLGSGRNSTSHWLATKKKKNKQKTKQNKQKKQNKENFKINSKNTLALFFI